MQTLLPGFLCIPIVLLARFVSVGAPIALIRRFRPFTPHTVRVLTWGGLRGAVSVALSLPAFPGREIVLASNYIVGVFSILVQGLTIGPLIRLRNSRASAAAADRKSKRRNSRE